MLKQIRRTSNKFDKLQSFSSIATKSTKVRPKVQCYCKNVTESGLRINNVIKNDWPTIASKLKTPLISEMIEIQLVVSESSHNMLYHERQRYNQFREVDNADILLDKELDRLVSSSNEDEDWFDQSDDNKDDKYSIEDDTSNRQFIFPEFNNSEIKSEYEYSNTNADFSDM
ncbi:867_t:CDS:2 [Funneliformis caledonium]|uniref:867_t:CDS:1 n=1 Tax=Funneliformis caledonium TaxID=1117310 RepID=A0A9N8YWC6_9GLOM|nr:867_t:CDS:2 [Funneliformis caledonium]